MGHVEGAERWCLTRRKHPVNVSCCWYLIKDSTYPSDPKKNTQYILIIMRNIKNIIKNLGN